MKFIVKTTAFPVSMNRKLVNLAISLSWTEEKPLLTRVLDKGGKQESQTETLRTWMTTKLLARRVVKRRAFCLLILVCATFFADRFLAQEVTATTTNWEESKVTAVRKSPSERSEVVATLAAYELFTATPTSENWWKIRKSNGLTGFIRKSEIETSKAFSKSLGTRLPVRASPSGQSAVVATLAPGEEFTAFYPRTPLGEPDRDWISVRKADGHVGFVPRNQVHLSLDWQTRDQGYEDTQQEVANENLEKGGTENPPLKGPSSLYFDSLGLFRKIPGDDGWYANDILAQPVPNRWSEAESYLKQNGFKSLGFTEDASKLATVGKTFYTYRPFPGKNYIIMGLHVPGFSEDTWVKRLRNSGVFQFAALESIPLGPESALISLPAKAVFSSAQPDPVKGRNFVRTFFQSHFQKLAPRPELSEVIMPEPFLYRITVLGNGRYLGTHDPNYWETVDCELHMHRQFDAPDGEIEIQGTLSGYRVAKGPPTSRPPEARFKPASVSNYMQLQRNIFQAMASEFGGKYDGP